MGVFDTRFVNDSLSKHPQYATCKKGFETGTNVGYSTQIMARFFETVETIEISSDLSAIAVERLSSMGIKNVEYHVGDSAKVLKVLLDGTMEPFLFLDAHWSGNSEVDWSKSDWKGYGFDTYYRGDKTDKPSSHQQVPLMEEFQIILDQCPNKIVIYIDDMKLIDENGVGKRDVGFSGEDWSHVNMNFIFEMIGDRLDKIERTPTQMLLFIKS